MADNFLSNNSENIFIEQEYNNIILVDPNKTIAPDGQIQERLVDHENLITFVNLEAEVLPRTKLSVGGSPQDTVTTVSIAKINFLAPNKEDFFTNGYYEELSGLNSVDGMGINQKTEVLQKSPKNKKSYTKSSVVSNGIDGPVNNGLLGIKSINVKLSTSFIPTVEMVLEDVQGKALFQLGDQSPYAAFFNLPYPPFYLTIKGYYGKAVKYQLNLEKFNARFRADDGNYEINLLFRGYKFNILNEIEIGSLLAVPHMYSSSYEFTKRTNQTQKEDVVESIITEKGYEKIVQVYSEYKSKGLIPQNFPEMTLAQFLNKIETFETNILENYPKANVQPLTDCRNYKKILSKYYNEIYSQDVTSWFSKWMNPKPLIGKNNEEFYLFRDFTPTQKDFAKKELDNIIKTNATKLNDSGVLGSLGRTPVENSIEVSDIVIKNFNSNILDLGKTITSLTGLINPQVTPQVVLSTIQKIYNVTIVKNENDSIQTENNNLEIINESVFRFDLFSEKVRIMDAEANRKLGEYETLITEDLSKKLEDDRLGIGFSPTVRNISAIIMASTEGFIRLMDEVHTNAWNKRNDPIRRRVILNNTSSAPSSDSKNEVYSGPFSTLAGAVGQVLNDSKIPVYPWPQFFIETPNDKKGRFQLEYIASPSVISLTQGNRYDVWPEVEFVEEYLKGLTQKFDPPLTQPPSNNNDLTNLVNINAIEFPQANLAYRNKEEIKFFYEIYERQFVSSHYTGFFRSNQTNLTPLIESIQDYESGNIVRSLSSGAPSLTFKLKNYVFNSTNYVDRLKEFSNLGTGRNYQDFIRDFFVTPYLRTLTENSFSLLETWEEGPIPQNSSTEVVEKLKQVINTTSNDFTILDTFPFTYQSWANMNMVDINQNGYGLVFNTNKTITVYNPRNVIANFDSITNKTVARPVTNFNYVYASSRSVSLPRIQAKDLLPTEGYAGTTVTSMLNTPYFINAIQQGVQNNREKKQYPYKAAAYLFINSLPLISLREQLKTKGEGADYIKNDYMFASLKKFGAIHKIPYAWILKMGSIWHRYKTYTQFGVDIIKDVWKDFDYIKNYDPITNNVQKKYEFTNYEGQVQSIQLNSNSNQTYNVEVGFYPKLINDFNVFYNGFELFEDYSNTEIQRAVDRGMRVVNLDGSNISNLIGGNSTLNLKTWSVMFPVEDIVINIRDCAPSIENKFSNLLIFPSFGCNINEARNYIQQGGYMNPNTGISGNKSIFNGSCRTYWGSPNYGYFDTSRIKKPKIDEYLNSTKLQSEEISPFRILSIDEEYTKIEEIFSVFDKKILDSFEKEFLDFSKPNTDISITAKTTLLYNGVDKGQTDIFRNFQNLMRNMMKVPPQQEGQQESRLFLNSIEEQQKILQNQIASFLQYDVIFRYGNPMNYNERIFNSFISYGANTEYVVNPIQFEPYVKNSLPSFGGSVTLQQSKQQFPNEWKELEIQVGFSTIDGMVYSDNGSYITDFFIDNNIKFTRDNISILSPIIKIYATQKLKNKNINQTEFRNQLLSFNATTEELQNNLLNGVMDKVRNNLPEQETVIETKFNSVVDGNISKVETYEKLKALNDKWIAGGDFTNKTYFEDILFLDRASRNIGDILLVDIFKLKSMIKKGATDSNLKMSVYTFLAGFLIENNFVIMNLPSYVNFYNRQNIDGVNTINGENNSNFANNLWGTFLNVDYTNSSPKMVCFFTGKPSQYLDLPENKYYRYRSDGYDFNNVTQTPNNEDGTNKTDETISNRCVGFTVDIGIRNQNIFRSFSVGQDNGKATAEAINTVYDMASQAAGVNVATQNTGLYNLYKQRSYTCDVSMLGNAMIQPTMYFNLRHVPMFNGAYLIQDVSHRISPGVFETSFKGIRQGMFDLPQIDKYLQSINRNLLTKLEQLVKTNKNDVPSIEITNQQKANNLQTDSSNKSSTPNSCVNSVLPTYLNIGFDGVETVQTSITPKELYDEIELVRKQFGGNNLISKLIYSFCYVTNYNNGQFDGFSNNYSTSVNLTKEFRPTFETFFNKTYSCVVGTDETKNSIPIANFNRLYDFVGFMYARLNGNIKIIEREGFWKYYCCDYPEVGKIPSSVFKKEKDSNSTYQKILLRLSEGITSMRNFGLDVNNIDEILTGKTKTSSTNVNSTTPVCDKPKIISWGPKTADYNSLSPEITISGTSLWGQTQVTLSGVSCTIKLNNENVIIVVPKKKINGKLKVTTKYGSDETEEDFIFTNLPTTG